MTFDEALSYLLSLGHETLTIKLGLANTETLLSALGDPHKEFPAVQIAGTNGKGSTAVTLDSICRAAAIRTGLFTSPHLISITERIRVNGEQISEKDFARFTTQVRATAEALIGQGRLETLPTFFEHVTAIALLAFREEKVELAILETGLGGRLDSTTAARADVVAITPIAMDREEYLGHSLAEIAAEKAAIIRPGVKAIIAPQSEEVLEVIARQCQANGVEPRFIERGTDLSLGYSLTTASNTYENIPISLLGRHQFVNTSTAIALAETLGERGFSISREAIIQGIETVTHPGRLELWEGQPAILLMAHTIRQRRGALRDYLDEFVRGPVTMIFAAMSDKALHEMAAALFSKANELILTELDNPRAATIEQLKSAMPEGFDQAKVRQVLSVRDAVKTAMEATTPDGLICVTGSLYLVGAVQKILIQESRSIAQQRAGH